MPQPTQCSLSLVFALIGLAIAGSISAVAFGARGYAWVALGAATTVLFAAIAISGAFGSYKQCRDNESGPSGCSTVSIYNYINAIYACMGTAILGFGAALALIYIPWVGQALSADATRAVTYLSIAGATGLLLALIKALNDYEACRNRR